MCPKDNIFSFDVFIMKTYICKYDNNIADYLIKVMLSIFNFDIDNALNRMS